MTVTLSRPESVKTSWPKLSALYLEECASKFIFKSRCSLYTIWCNLKTLSVKWRSHCLGLAVLTYCEQFLVVSIWQSMLPNQFPNLGAMWIKYCFHTIVWRMAAIFLGLNVLTWLLLKQNSFCRRHLNIYFRICFTFAYAVVILKNEFEIMVCKISAILSLPGCVNTLWQRQSDLYFEDNIFNFIINFRWNLNKI